MNLTSPSRAVKLWAACALVFWFLHAVDSLRLAQPYNLLWACNIACLLIGLGLALDKPLAHSVGVLWLAFGIWLWVIDLVGGGEFKVTSLLTHVGGLAAGLAVLGARPFVQGAWWKSVAAWLVLQQVCRWTTPPKENLNLAFSVWPGWESVFPSYAAYNAFFVVTSGLFFYLIEKGAARWAAARVEPA